MKPSLGPLRILVVCQDAGGAEILSSLLRKERGAHRWRVLAPRESPAFGIFARKGFPQSDLEAPEGRAPADLLGDPPPDLLFCGSGWNNVGLEHGLIREARRRKATSLSFLDHWINYRERFDFPRPGWEGNLPDHIVVGDAQAWRLAQSLGLGGLLRLRNHYLQDFIDEYEAAPAPGRGGRRLLIPSFPISRQAAQQFGDPLYFGYTEEGLVADILERWPGISRRLSLDAVTIRLHPGESADKYDGLLSRFPDIGASVEEARSLGLAASLKASSFVIGSESMALFQACLVGKNFVSYMPTQREYHIPIPPGFRISDLAQLEDLDLTRAARPAEDLLYPPERDLKAMLEEISEGRPGGMAP